MKTRPPFLLACLSAALLLAACGQDAPDDHPVETTRQRLDNAPGGDEGGYPDDALWDQAVANRDAAKKNNGRRPPSALCTTFANRCYALVDNCNNCRDTRARAHGHWSCEDPCASAADTCANAVFICSL
jgi:hypothetical protein